MEDKKDKRQWWLVTTKSRQEERAEDNLNRQGYKTYRPLAKRLRKHRGVMKTKIESLFPGYIFIHLDQLNDNWTPVRSTIGVNKIITFGNKPAKVPEKIIDTLMQQEELLSEKAIDLDRYKKGDTVKIEQEGAYKGMQAIFQNYDGEQRIQVLLEILHKEAILSLSTSDISSL